MAFDITKLPEYVEQNRDKLISALVLAPKSTDMFSHISGIYAKTMINTMQNSVVLQSLSCSFNPEGTTEFAQVELNPIGFKVNEEWCDLDLLNTVHGAEVRVKAGGEELPYEEMIMSDITARLGLAIERGLWQGMNIGTNHLSGIEEILSANTSNSVKVNFNDNDIVKTVENVILSIPDEVFEQTEFAILMSANNFRKYIFALGAKDLYHYNPNIDEKVFVPNTNIEVKVVPMSNDTIIAGDPRFIYYGYSTDENPWTEYKVWYSNDNQVFRMSIKGLIGIAIAFQEYFVIAKKSNDVQG